MFDLISVPSTVTCYVGAAHVQDLLLVIPALFHYLLANAFLSPWLIPRTFLLRRKRHFQLVYKLTHINTEQKARIDIVSRRTETLE